MMRIGDGFHPLHGRAVREDGEDILVGAKPSWA